MKEMIKIRKNWARVPYVWIACELCWKEHWHHKYQLKAIKSCWCLKNKRRHPELYDRAWYWKSKSPIWKKRYYMMSRCYSKSNIAYHKYWWRWIWVSDRWKDFYNFYDDMIDSYIQHSTEHWDKNTSLDRVDSSLWYSFENCRWTTITWQNNNLSSNRYFEFQWENKTIPQIAYILWVNKHTLRTRMRRHDFNLQYVLKEYY